MAPKLIFPQEIEVWYVLPAIRKKVALKMVEQGLAQNKVADIMGITPAAVCQYKKQKRAKVEIFDEEMEKELEKSVKKIIKDNHQLSTEIINLNNKIKEKGIICKIYKKVCALNNVKGDCPYCKKKK